MAAFAYGGVTFREFVADFGSPVEAWGSGEQTITAKLKVNWSDRQAARMALLGYPTLTSRQAGGTTYWYVARSLPHQYPDPASAWLYARSVPQIKGLDQPIGKDANGVMQYGEGVITCVYGSLDYDVASDDQVRAADMGGTPDESTLARYVVKRAPPQEREYSLSFRAGSWAFTDTGKPVAGVQQRAWVISRLTYTWVQVPEAGVPRHYILGSVGYVNADTFDGWAPGTLLLRAPKWDRKRLANGLWVVNVSLIMDHNPYTWNTAPDPTRGNNIFPIAQFAVPGVPGSGVVAQPYANVVFRRLLEPSPS